MNSYLYPDKYFDDYAECLNVDIDILKVVGELCETPNIEKETLSVKEIVNN